MSRTVASEKLTQDLAKTYATTAIDDDKFEKLVVEKTSKDVFKVTRTYTS